MPLKTLIHKVIRYDKSADIPLLERAYKTAQSLLKDIKRSSGRPEMEHNIEVALLLADIKADDITIVAALMHNLMDKDRLSFSGIKKNFGEQIANLIQATEKNILPDMSKYTDISDFRKILMTAIKDPRVLLIKIADKVSSLRDIEGIKDHELKVVIAKEALNIYAPLAHKLGLGLIKNELEDLSFKILEPKIYNEIVSKLENTKEQRNIILQKTKRLLTEKLEKNGIKAEIYGRTKHIYSIYKKILTRSYSLEKMKDIIGIRIIVDSIETCYNILRLINEVFTPVQDTFKDYIAMPKPNGYQSLHEIILGPDNSMIEIQIRTKEMHEYAEEGIAAHAEYKGIVDGKEFDKKMYWLKEAINVLSKTKTMDLTTLELFSNNIYVLTPKKEVIELPNYATPIDFAYAVHSSLGNTCMGAYVNDKYVSLDTPLKNGDIVRIVTKKDQRPSIDWLRIVVTSKAREKIRQTLKKYGKLVPSFSSNSNMHDISFLVKPEKKEGYQVIQDARCNPLPMDKILAQIQANNILIVHKIECPRIKNKKEAVGVSWKKITNLPLLVTVEANDRVGLLSDIIQIFSNLGINIESVNANRKNLLAVCIFKTKIKDMETLAKIVSAIRATKDVKNIFIQTEKKS